MTALVDLTGQTFGWWTVIRRDRSVSVTGHVYWECRCECGAVRSVRGASLRSGRSSRCAQCTLYTRPRRKKRKGKIPMASSAATLGYSYEPRLNGRYFAVLRHTMWRGREGTKFVVGYDNEADAQALVTELSLRKLKEGPRPE